MFRSNILKFFTTLLLILALPASAEEKSYIYEKPTMETLSQLYWSLGKFDTGDDEAIDNYLKINECDIYNAFIHDEFEWVNIRQSTRDYIAKNKKKFPVRFALVQPLRLKDYDLQTHEFGVFEPYQVNSMRRFEVLLPRGSDGVCNSSGSIPGYPENMYVELSRPFTLTSLKIEPEIAKKFIDERLAKAQELGEHANNLYASREVFMVMNIRIFSIKEDVSASKTQNIQYAQAIAVLESFEVYADSKLDELLFSENFMRERKRSSEEMEMKKRYKEMLKQELGGANRAEQPAKAETVPSTNE